MTIKILLFSFSKQLFSSFPPENIANCEIVKDVLTDIYDNFLAIIGLGTNPLSLHLKLVYIFSPILTDRRVCPLGLALVVLSQPAFVPTKPPPPT